MHTRSRIKAVQKTASGLTNFLVPGWPARLPVVLTRDEVGAVLAHLDGVLRHMVTLLYGSGLRLLECCRLRVKDIDFGQNQILVREGKGGRDRATILPGSLRDDIE